MKFLILIIAVLIQCRKPLIRWSLPTAWFSEWVSWMGQKSFVQKCADWQRYLFVVGLPVGFSMLMFYWLESWLWGLASLAIEILILAILIRPAASWVALQSYREHLDHGDFQGAFYCARKYVGEECAAISRSSMNQGVIRVLTHRWFEHFFLLLFWYLLLGMGGVILVWLTALYSSAEPNDDEEGKSDTGIINKTAAALHWISWVPVRLLGLTFCLVGDFSSGFSEWKAQANKTRISNDEFLAAVAQKCLAKTAESAPKQGESEAEQDESIHELNARQNLFWESALIWLAVLAAASIAGWIL